MHARGLAPLLAAALLAPLALAAEPQGETHPWNLLGCAYVYVVAPAPSARVAPHLPPGFQTATIERVPGPAVTQVAFEMETCHEGAGLHGQIAPMSYAQTSVPVMPPVDLRVDNLGAYLKFHPLVPDEDRRAHFVARGMPAHGGSVHIGAAPTAASPARFDATTTYEGLGSYRFDLVAFAPDTPTGGEFTQFLEGTDGSLTYWRTKWSATTVHRVVGTVELPENSLEAQMLGATTVPVRGSFGAWSYTDGKVVFMGG